ncbi:MAG: elongation factor G [Candidatus Nasuia deltocephalinicola]
MSNTINLKNFRNIGISAHIDAGKTTTTERILYYTGVNYKMGEVHEGKATMDWMEQEQERGITITSAATTVFWSVKNLNKINDIYKINIIDTPGHVDFTLEVERSMRVIDGACMVYCSVSGLQSQSETVWRQSVKYNISKLIFVNKMDRPGNDFYKIYDDLKRVFSANPVPIFIPYFFNDNFYGLIDLLNFKLVVWDEKSFGMFYCYYDIPYNYLDISLKWRNNIIDVSLSDDFLIDKFLENNLFNYDIIFSLRNKTINNIIQPMLCGSSLKNKGVQCLLDCISIFLPSPEDLGCVKCYSLNGDIINIKPSKDNDFLALAFKIMNDPFIGQLIFFRVYSGKINVGDFVFNPKKNKKEKLSRILRIHANHKEDVKCISVGDIAAAVGLKTFATGDTICSNQLLVLDSISFPEPVISQSLIIDNKYDEDKIINILTKLNNEDPSFKHFVDNDSKQIIISGMGELHLDVIVERIRRDYNINIATNKPRVSYKETIKKGVKNIEGKYIRQSGGRGQYGHVIIDIEPNSRGAGFDFINCIKGGSIPKEYIPSIEKSFKNCLESGFLKGYPIIDIVIHLIDGSYHEVDSSENAFKIAASIAFKDAFKMADPYLLEPIMYVDVETPEEYLSVILGDISSRRGDLVNIDNSFNNYKILKCKIPLSEIFNYSTVLRSLTKGRASYNMYFAYYNEVPYNIFKNI